MKEPGVSTFKLTQHEVVFPRPIIIGIQLGGSAILLLDYARHQLYSSAWSKFPQSLNLVWCSLTILSLRYTPKKTLGIWDLVAFAKGPIFIALRLPFASDSLWMTNSHWLSSRPKQCVQESGYCLNCTFIVYLWYNMCGVGWCALLCFGDLPLHE